MVDRCICCGAIIPEGRQVCGSCESDVPTKQYSKKKKVFLTKTKKTKDSKDKLPKK